MGLECGGIKGLVGVGVGREDWVGNRGIWEGYLGKVKSTVGVGKEESQLLSEFTLQPYS